MSESDAPKPIPLEEILKQGDKPKRPQGRVPVPIGVGHVEQLGSPRTYRDDDEDEIPNRGVIGARVIRR